MIEVGDRSLTDDQQARILAEEGQRRLSYLYQATATLFVAPPDFKRRLQLLAALLVPDLGDWCWIDLVEGATLERVVTHHWNATLLERNPRGPEAMAHDDTQLCAPEPLVVDPSVRRVIQIPIRDHGGVIGRVTLMFMESNRRYRPEDLELASELVTRGGWALDAARQYERATRAVAAREDILAVVAHDLRNPLSTVLMATSLLSSSETLDPSDQRAVERIERAGLKMEKLVQDLLDWSTIESGRLSVQLVPVSLHALLDDADELLTPLASARGLHLVIERDDRQIDVMCDRARTSQLFSNLVGNAIKLSPKDGTIRVSYEVNETAVKMLITDQGPGIDPAHLPRIFDRYWQAEDGTARRQGVGLGLAISSGIAVAQRGEIGVTSVLGQGAQFSFTLLRVLHSHLAASH